MRISLPGVGWLSAILWSSRALGCPYCAQDRGPAVFLIGAISLLPLLLVAAVWLFLRRIERTERRGA